MTHPHVTGSDQGRSSFDNAISLGFGPWFSVCKRSTSVSLNLTAPPIRTMGSSPDWASLSTLLMLMLKRLATSALLINCGTMFAGAASSISTTTYSASCRTRHDLQVTVIIPMRGIVLFQPQSPPFVEEREQGHHEAD